MKYCLIFENKSISYKIAFFSSEKEAEHWRDFLAYTIQEFKYEEMKIIEVKIKKRNK